MPSHRILSALVLLLLAPFAVATASASECVVDTRPRDFVCFGEEWCTVDMCGIPVCVDDTMDVCVNEAPDAGPEGCVLTPTSDLGLVCYGQPWCDVAMCATPICLTDERKICVLEG